MFIIVNFGHLRGKMLNKSFKLDCCNIAFLRNTLGIDIDNNEITPDISLPKVYFTNEQRLLLSNLKWLIAVRNGNLILPYISSYEFECLITNIATL